VALGTTLNYRPDGAGFFLTPADRDSNNVRLDVEPAATRQIRFL